MKEKVLNHKGFTLIELLVAMVLSLAVMGMIFLTFKSQQDSSLVQEQVATMQQNLRGAMYLMTSDVQMAGYYTNFVPTAYTMDWDNLDGDSETIRPLIYGLDNRNDGGGGDGIKDDTDVLVVVKANSAGRQLASGESASGLSATSSLRNVGSLTLASGMCALFVKSDLSGAEFCQINNDSGAITLASALNDSYTQNDWIYPADVVIYYVSDSATNPCLMRNNLGNNSGPQIVAENIDNLQLRYQLDTGTWTNNPAGNEEKVRAVEISLLARTARAQRGYTDPNTYNIGNNPNPSPNDNYRRRLLCSIVKTRNIGL